MTREQQLAVARIAERYGADASRLELLLLAALVAADDTQRAAQLTKLATIFGADLPSRLESVRQDWDVLPAVTRLPAIAQLLPQIGAASAAHKERWLRVVEAFARVTAPADTTAFALIRVLRHELAPRTTAAAATSAPLTAHTDAVSVLFSLVAHESGAQAPEAYRVGLQDLLPPQRRPPLIPLPLEAARVDAALAALATLHPSVRRAVCAGLARIVARNQSLSVGEADWLRTASILLEAPLPVIRLDLKFDAAASG
jgi:hypothetical protein